jgi:hypothetical protein
MYSLYTGNFPASTDMCMQENGGKVVRMRIQKMQFQILKEDWRRGI